MYVYMYVRMYICMCLCMNVCMYVHSSVCTYVYDCVMYVIIYYNSHSLLVVTDTSLHTGLLSPSLLTIDTHNYLYSMLIVFTRDIEKYHIFSIRTPKQFH